MPYGKLSGTSSDRLQPIGASPGFIPPLSLPSLGFLSAISHWLGTGQAHGFTFFTQTLCTLPSSNCLPSVLSLFPFSGHLYPTTASLSFALDSVTLRAGHPPLLRGRTAGAYPPPAGVDCWGIPPRYGMLPDGAHPPLATPGKQHPLLSIERVRYKLRKVPASQVCGVLRKAFVWALGGEKLHLGLIDPDEDPSFRPEPSGNESEIACVDPTRHLRGPPVGDPVWS